MVKVYFESDSYSEHIATFNTESIYIKCLPTLQQEAKELNMIVTESML